jgi:hypothetical protein
MLFKGVKPTATVPLQICREFFFAVFCYLSIQLSAVVSGYTEVSISSATPKRSGFQGSMGSGADLIGVGSAARSHEHGGNIYLETWCYEKGNTRWVGHLASDLADWLVTTSRINWCSCPLQKMFWYRLNHISIIADIIYEPGYEPLQLSWLLSFNIYHIHICLMVNE